MADTIGAMRERLVIQQNLWPTLIVTSLTRSGSTATVVTESAHNYQTNDYVTVSGATPTAYNGKVKVTRVDATTFTYPVYGAPSSPASGPIAVIYTGDAQGGRRANWVTLDTVFAEMVPMTGAERMQVSAVQAINVYKFRIRARIDLSPKMRASFTPRWPPRAPAELLQINNISPDQDPWASGGGIRFQILSCSGVAA